MHLYHALCWIKNAFAHQHSLFCCISRKNEGKKTMWNNSKLRKKKMRIFSFHRHPFCPLFRLYIYLSCCCCCCYSVSLLYNEFFVCNFVLLHALCIIIWSGFWFRVFRYASVSHADAFNCTHILVQCSLFPVALFLFQICSYMDGGNCRNQFWCSTSIEELGYLNRTWIENIIVSVKIQFLKKNFLSQLCDRFFFLSILSSWFTCANVHKQFETLFFRKMQPNMQFS